MSGVAGRSGGRRERSGRPKVKTGSDTTVLVSVEVAEYLDMIAMREGLTGGRRAAAQWLVDRDQRSEAVKSFDPDHNM